MLRTELRKILGSNVVIWLFVCLLALDFGLVCWTSGKGSAGKAAVRKAYDAYLIDPDGTDEYYKGLERMFIAGFRDDDLKLPVTYDASGNVDDLAVLDQMYQRRDYLDGWVNRVRQIESMASSNANDLIEYGYSDGSPRVRAQSAVAQKYAGLYRNVHIDAKSGYAYGYDTYFEESNVMAFALIFSAVVSSFVFLTDGSGSGAGSCELIRSAKRGRLATAALKLLAAILVSAAATVFFSAAAFLAVGIREGFSSPASPVQLLPDFYSVPYPVTMAGYLALNMALKLVGVIFFSVSVAAAATLTRGYIASFAVVGALIYGNYALFGHNFQGTASSLKYLNPAALLDANKLLSFFRVAHIPGIGAVVSIVPLACLLVLLLTAAIMLVPTILWCRRGLSSGRGSIRALAVRVLSLVSVKLSRSRRKGKHRHCQVMLPVWIYELKKSRFIMVLPVIILLLVFRVQSVRGSIGNMENYGEALYYEYITGLQGLSDDEVRAAVDAERSRLDEIIGKYRQMEAAYASKKISALTYMTYLDQYHEAKSRSDVFSRVESYVLYIEVRHAAGVPAQLIYTTGYSRLFGLPADILLYAAVLMLTLQAFTVEYYGNNGGFSCIMRTTKNGRDKAARTKFVIYMIAGGICGGAFGAAALYAVKQAYILPDPGSLLASVMGFDSVSSGITIRGFIALSLLMCLAGGMLMAIASVALSGLCRRVLPAVAASVILTLLPEVLFRTGVDALRDSTALTFTALGSMISGASDPMIYASMICVLHILLCVCLALGARKRFCG